MCPASSDPATYHHGDLRRAIRDEALRVIDDQGLEAVSLRGLARRLGVSEAAPYHHYQGKNELLATIAADSYTAFHDRLTGAVQGAGDDPFERLAAFGRAYVEYGLENRGRFRLMFGEHMVELAAYEQVFAAGRPTRIMLTDVVAACIGTEFGDPTSVEHSVWGLVHGITWLVAEAEIGSDGTPAEVDRLVDLALSILGSGIRALTEYPVETHRVDPGTRNRPD